MSTHHRDRSCRQSQPFRARDRRLVTIPLWLRTTFYDVCRYVWHYGVLSSADVARSCPQIGPQRRLTVLTSFVSRARTYLGCVSGGVRAPALWSFNLLWHVACHRFDRPRCPWRSHSPASLAAQMFTVDMPPGLPIIAEGLEGISEAGGFARRGHVQRLGVTTGCPGNCLLKGSPFESIADRIAAW